MSGGDVSCTLRDDLRTDDTGTLQHVHSPAVYRFDMEEERARRVVETLRSRNVFAHVKLPQAGITQYGVRVILPDGREAIWDNDGTAGLEAQIMRDGVLVGFVPSIPDSENYGDAQIINAIATADYNRPVGRSHPSTRPSANPNAHPAPRPAIGLAQRLRGSLGL